MTVHGTISRFVVRINLNHCNNVLKQRKKCVQATIKRATMNYEFIS